MVSFNDEIKEGKQSTVVSSLQLKRTGDKQNKSTEQIGFKVTLILGKFHALKTSLALDVGLNMVLNRKTDKRQTVRQSDRHTDK